ncbi:MAG TPA: metallophosphoesterase [Acidimicrobiales bacterium]|nr:metallophosphoesterase [Acidimicrobiales bacterium]
MSVFAVEHDSLQITWSRLQRAQVRFQIGDQSFDVDATPPEWYRRTGGLRAGEGNGGPGALTAPGLEPSTSYDVLLSGDGIPRRRVAVATTLGKPPGRLLSRFATISDCHFGERRLGALHRLHDPAPRPDGLEPYPVRCAASAIEEAENWGASMIVAKGDLTQDSKAAEYETAVDVLGRASVPVAITFGNHDVRGPVPVERAADMLSAQGFIAAASTRVVDMDGLRLVLSHTPVPDRHVGRMTSTDIEEVIGAARDTALPVVVALHHPLRRWPVHTHYPPPLGWADSRELSRGLRAANARSLVIAGHTHRNRRYRVGGVTVVEVGSTKDYPGQWAGYSVYEGGIRQVVRRVERRDAVAWTQMTGRAVGGIWRWWSPGDLDDRCWSIEW